MVILIAGASHTGKTVLAQKLLQKYGYPYLSIDHLKMGLIRSGNTTLTPESDDQALTDYLWPIVAEIVKTAIENKQNLVIEGCYIPFDWAKDFEQKYLAEIKYCCLVMSENYIRSHYADIKAHASDIERLLDIIRAPKSIAEIGLDPSILPMSFHATKDIRDKYVLSRLCWDLGIIDEIDIF